MGAVPVPRMLDDRLQIRILRLPSEDFLRLRGPRHQTGRIPGPPRRNLDRDVVPGHFPAGVDHLLDDLGAANVSLSADVIERLNALINQHTVHGSRYNPQDNSEVDTEVF